MLEHPGRATSWVRAATTFILPETADVPIYPIWWGGGNVGPSITSATGKVEFCKSGEKGSWDGLFLASPGPGTSQKDRPTDPDPSPSHESYDVDRSIVFLFLFD